MCFDWSKELFQNHVAGPKFNVQGESIYANEKKNREQTS